jgi:hypothetical protein
MGAFCPVMRGVDPWHIEEDPEQLAFALQARRKRPGVVRPCGVLTKQMPETHLPGSPLAHRGPLRAPMTPLLQLGVHAVSKTRRPSVEGLRQALGRTDQMGQAALPQPLPGLRHQIPITH